MVISHFSFSTTGISFNPVPEMFKCFKFFDEKVNFVNFLIPEISKDSKCGALSILLVSCSSADVDSLRCPICDGIDTVGGLLLLDLVKNWDNRSLYGY